MNTTQNSKELLIFNFLNENKSKWFNSRTIMNYFCLESGQHLRLIIKILRIKGNPIIASNLGYKLLDLKNYKDKIELENYIKARSAEIKSEKRVIDSLSRNLCFPRRLFNYDK